MLCPPKKGYTEEDYYFGEWSAAERENGEHLTVVKFVRLDIPRARALLGSSCVMRCAIARWQLLAYMRSPAMIE